MYEKIYLLEYQNRFLGHASARRSMVFAFKHRKYAEYVQQHIKHDCVPLEEISPHKYLLKSHYNPNNVFTGQIIDTILTKEKRLYSLILQVGVNDMGVGLVHTVMDRDDGDLELSVNPMKTSMPIDDDVVKFNLELILKTS